MAAASTLLGMIRDGTSHSQPATITVYPNLVVRKSTALAPMQLPASTVVPAC